MPNVEEMIRTYIEQNILFSGDGYPDDASFLAEGIVDSMNVLELVMFVEETFEISVKDQDIVPANFDSVSKLAAYVRRSMGEQPQDESTPDQDVRMRTSAGGVSGRQ